MPAKKTVKKKAVKKAPAKKAAKKATPKAWKDCEHCEGTGKCAAGVPYDKSRGQVFGAKIRLTSCFECLDAAGEHRNSKKLVKCRFCGGEGKV